MIEQTKHEVRRSLGVDLLSLRHSELLFYTKGCRVVGIASVALAGLGHITLQYRTHSGEATRDHGLIKHGVRATSIADTPFDVLYVFFLLIQILLGLAAVQTSMLCTLLGPGVALRATDESEVHAATLMMRRGLRLSLRFFLAAIADFHFVALAYYGAASARH